MLMPGKNGRETFHDLQSINPDVKVIIATGYSDGEDSYSVLQDGVAGFIRKPFDHAEFSRLVQNVLATRTRDLVRPIVV
jgi:DNA-binding NarL/FixJ family response regulator